jgi:hypothetical protein
LFFAPTASAQFFHISVGCTISGLSHKFHVLKQSALCIGQACLFHFAFKNCGYAFIGGSLDPQEVSVAVNSIRTVVQIRDIAGDHFFVAPGEMPLGKVDGVGELHNLSQEIGPRAKALDDSG